MSVAVVFDSAGTLLRTYRVARDLLHDEMLTEVETTTITFGVEARVLVVLHLHSRDVMEAPEDRLLSEFFLERSVGFGVACSRRVIPAEEVADILYTDRRARIGDLQACIRKVWSCCKRESIVTMNSGVILNMDLSCIEFTVTTGGRPFSGAREAISELHRMGVPAYIASGDRVTKLERMGDYLGIPRERVYGVATPSMKARIVEDLKEQYNKVVMVGDAINDLHAFRKADLALLTEQQSDHKPDILYTTADRVIRNVSEVPGIVAELLVETTESGKSATI
ncbi:MULTISPECIES: HAD family hydrolase [unclassified Methanoculleus]|uniref:HAD family hydrolase n=1 Tax=unclassified Methanoculleus TaxID=2619537 RepID=UPI0025D4AB3E|nr:MULTISPECIES: HAD family hydrolase [unclassified Methanoculleus]MCK9317625.1 HAD family hydrolase [Methanoculleus sp.]MDD2253509.1 HAD family hydrolase [Methanoculleus sp.]MDD2788389.1 HAD family hydrolase [Methanoculleus sp.]MDD3215669.1 HAD family hydrolase [Methanoculleus sp.]MDD4313411.1 HAD family hydrolase [Methanoculleus sp.]